MQVEIVHSQAVHHTVTAHGASRYQFIQVPDMGAYGIRLRNTTPRRQLVVVSVDGLNVLDGQEASVDGGGYVLRPWETLDIPGWRRSDGTVAAFTVKPQEASYTAQTGHGTVNVGVIGVAVFEEKVVTTQLHPSSEWWKTLPGYWPWGQQVWGPPRSYDVMAGVTYSNSVGAASEAAPTQVGTAYGAEVAFHTATTEFVRASTQPAEVIQLRYGTRAQLVSWGVLPATPVPPPQAPNPFPKSRPSCAPPPGWRG